MLILDQISSHVEEYFMVSWSYDLKPNLFSDAWADLGSIKCNWTIANNTSSYYIANTTDNDFDQMKYMQ